MDSFNQQGVAWGKETDRVIIGDKSSDTNLRGNKARFISSIVHIVCGLIEFVLGIAILLVPFTQRYYPTKYVGWGIWNGVFACVTGFYGIYSKRGRCMVITYMVLAITGAIFSCASLIWASITASKINIIASLRLGAITEDYRNARMGELFGKMYTSKRDYFVQYFMYVTLCLAFAVQIVMAIIGAGFTCFDLLSTNAKGFQNQERVYINSGTTSTKLPGLRVRLICGVLQIFLGVLEVALGVTLLFLPLYYFDRPDNVGWGIWNGVFALATGIMGISSGRNKCRIKAYIVTTIVATLLSALCFVCHWVILSFLTVPDESRSGPEYVTHVTIYVILCASFGLQMLSSMIGVGHSCGDVRSKNNESEIQDAVYRYDGQETPSQQLE